VVQTLLRPPFDPMEKFDTWDAAAYLFYTGADSLRERFRGLAPRRE